MITAIYPGGFDPVTNGHLDIVRRAALLFDEVVVAVSKRETSLFTLQERVEMMKEAVQETANARVDSYEGLTVTYARSIGARALVRGMRAVTGFETEFDMALMNKKMAPEIEAVFLMASLEHLFISASRIREIAELGHPTRDLVPPHVARALEAKFGPPRR